MSDRPSPNLSDLDIDLARRVDVVCRRFEADWREGRQPSIEDYLDDFPEESHGTLRASLVALLRALYPSLRRAAEFQRQLLTATRIEALRPTPFYGLLPAGESAEDLYSADWHHYWDDF